MFTFKMEIINIGQPIGLLGRNYQMEISGEKPFNVNEFPRLFRNGSEQNRIADGSYIGLYGFALGSNSRVSVLFVYDSSMAEANRFKAFLNDDHDTVYTPSNNY